ncbi:MAG: tripartite tricarboxylate transporter TctB family protein [Geminicoccaceae bacterium]
MTFSDAALGLIVLIAGVVIVFVANGFPEMAGMTYGPAFFPTLIGVGFGLCGLSLLISGVLAWRREDAGAWLTLPGWLGDRRASMRASGVVVAVIAYALLSGWLGFLLTVFLITAGLLLLLDVSKPVSAAIAVALPLILHYGFSVILRVPLPRGPIESFLY